MPKSPASNKTRLLPPWALLLITGALGGLLWFNFQDEKIFAPGDRTPDQISLTYTQLLLALHPDDAELRLRLVEQLQSLGDYSAARTYIEQWPQPDTAVKAFYLSRIDAMDLPANAASAPLVARLNALDSSRFSLAQLQDLASTLLRLESPASAATIYARLAERDPAQRQRWLLSQAQWAVAAGDPSQAAAVYTELEKVSETSELKRQYLQQAFDQYLAADRGERAVALLMTHLPKLDRGALSLLEQGVVVALSQPLLSQAQDLFDHARSLQPDSPQWLAKDFELRLAVNNIQGAWASGQALVALHPDDIALLQRVAEVGEWSDAKPQALTLWLAALQLQPDPVIRERAVRLALALKEYPQVIALLAPTGEQRRLSDSELDALLYAYASSAHPADAEPWLHTYLERNPEHRQAWYALLQNQHEHQSNSIQAHTWAEIEHRFGLSPEQRVQWADAYLRDADPAAAWHALQTDTQAIDDPRFWRSRASVAWMLKDQEHLHEALERLLAVEGRLNDGDRSALVDYYRERDPSRALSLAMDGWQQGPTPQSLALALQLALEQNDWASVQQLLDAADQRQQQYHDLEPQPLQVIARGTLATHAGQPEEAARIFRQGLQRFADNDALRERLLWLYLDQGELTELKPLVTQWRTSARAIPVLWLPMASASLALGNTRQALAWYRLYLSHRPDDWLVHAAYADALDAAGYQDSALRLRRTLVRDHPANNFTRPCTPCMQTWLRLVASSVSPVQAQRRAWQWQDGSPALLQLWFDQLLASLDANGTNTERDKWLAWARDRGLKVSRAEDLQQALRSDARQRLQSLLARRDLTAGQRAELLNRIGRPGEARQLTLAALNNADASTEQTAADLRSQAVQLEAAHPQGVQLSWNSQDYGGLRIDGPALRVAGVLGSQWYADLKYSQGRYQSDELVSSTLGEEHNLLLALERTVENGSYTAILDGSQRDDHNRSGAGIARSWQLSADQQLQAGLDWHRQSDETGLMRAFAQRDQLYVAGSHALSARDQLGWRLSQKHFSTRDGESMGTGQALNVVVNHVIAAATPAWAVRGGLDYQRNQLRTHALDKLGSNQGGALDLNSFSTQVAGVVTPQDLLQERYGQVYVGSTWRRGNPGALTRTTPHYTWLVDTNLGWEWEEQSLNYGIVAGVGIGVLGNDELALKLGYQSAPQGSDGKAGGVLNLSYSVRFGH